jgi:hypothetical protein
MKTQIDIPDPLHFRAKVYAACNKTTLAALVNEGLTDLLKRKQAKQGNPLRIRKGEKV